MTKCYYCWLEVGHKAGCPTGRKLAAAPAYRPSCATCSAYAIIHDGDRLYCAKCYGLEETKTKEKTLRIISVTEVEK